MEAAEGVAGVSVLNGIACESATQCIAVGSSQSGEGVVVPVSNSVAGEPVAVAGTTSLQSVACEGGGTCIGVGVGASGEGVVVPISNAVPGAATTVANAGELDGVACLGSSCVAVGADPAYSHSVVMDITGTTAESPSR